MAELALHGPIPVVVASHLLNHHVLIRFGFLFLLILFAALALLLLIDLGVVQRVETEGFSPLFLLEVYFLLVISQLDELFDPVLEVQFLLKGHLNYTAFIESDHETLKLVDNLSDNYRVDYWGLLGILSLYVVCCLRKGDMLVFRLWLFDLHIFLFFSLVFIWHKRSPFNLLWLAVFLGLLVEIG